MSDSPPVEIRRRTLAGTIRHVAGQLDSAVPDTPTGLRLGLQLALYEAAARAEIDAEDARFAAASLARVRAAVAALDAQLVRGDTGERWVLDQITRAIEET